MKLYKENISKIINWIILYSLILLSVQVPTQVTLIQGKFDPNIQNQIIAIQTESLGTNSNYTKSIRYKGVPELNFAKDILFHSTPFNQDYSSFLGLNFVINGIHTFNISSNNNHSLRSPPSIS